MPKAYKVRKRTMNFGERKGETLYNVSPVSFGTLTTEESAKQIAEESASTPGDVKAVLDRYVHYVVEMFAKLKSLFPDSVICGHRDLPGTTPKSRPCLDAARCSKTSANKNGAVPKWWSQNLRPPLGYSRFFTHGIVCLP